MDLITRADLFYKDYSWEATPDDDPKEKGKIDSGLLSRKEGYEVLDFINAFAKIHNLTKKEDSIKVERMLRSIGTDVHSKASIVGIIVKNWSSFK